MPWVIIDALLFTAGVLPAAAGAYLLILALAAFRRSTPPAPAESGLRLAVLVPAHDESELIGRCLESLRDQDYPRDRYQVVVIADNCQDGSADIARAAGCEAMERTDPERPGKGRALRWAMDRLLAERPPDAFVVVDADSVADRGCLRQLEIALRTAPAAQAEYLVLEEPDGRPRLATTAFLLFHRVRFAGLARLGMSVPLVGNGMAFRSELVRRVPWSAFSAVEDLEYSLDLRAAGVRIAFAAQARVRGPMPGTGPASASQRRRWEGGRFHLVRTRLPGLAAEALRRGRPDLLATAWDLAVPPLSLLCLGVLAGFVLTVIVALLHRPGWWATLPWLLAALLLAAYVPLGLWAAGEPAAAWRPLLGAPRFVLGKLAVYARLARGFDPGRWERTARPGELATGRTTINGVPLDPIPSGAALDRIECALLDNERIQVCTVNLDYLVTARHDPEVFAILRASELNLADGWPVVWLGRIVGGLIPERVAGSDLVPQLVGRCARAGRGIFFLGGENGAAEAAAVKMRQLHPGVRIDVLEIPRASLEEMDSAAMVERINTSGAALLLVALGHPKQDKWIARHRRRLSVSVAIGVGCSLDLLAGRRRRAPVALQRLGLEWLFRLSQEPRRLFRRYAADGIWLVLTAGELLLVGRPGRS